MIKTGVKEDLKLLKSRIRKGIPQAIRGIAWPEIIGLKQFINQKQNNYTYGKLINTPSSSIY
jgi:hypothetical protein